MLVMLAARDAEAQDRAPRKLDAAIDAQNAALDALGQTIAPPARRDRGRPKAASGGSDKAGATGETKPAAHAITDPTPRPGAITITPSGFFAIESGTHLGR